MNTFPYSIGFDQLLERLNRTGNMAMEKYPPCNVIQNGENEYMIEMSVAGFSEKDIDIVLHNGVLTISSKPYDGDIKKNPEVKYLHQGLAARRFSRSFNVPETIEVREASLLNGILTINLENVIPESMKPKHIKIQSPKQLLTEKAA